SVQETTLGDGDIVRLGASFFVFRGRTVEPQLLAASPALPGVHTLVGAHHMQLARLARVATTTIPVLLRGETGTGKEVLARAIHSASGRKGPFVAVNCGAITPTLIESQLFGHVKGAFTGAAADRRGMFELAEGGTLFLDEVGELPVAVQVKLLRALQEREIRRVGENRSRAIDVRVVAATSRPLEQMVEDGEFRQDLFYRLAVMPLHIPPLRARREDIAPLAEHPKIERWREEMSAGEFWSSVGEDWIRERRPA
ncbi:MAG: sigma-54 factor interaction domain-containing protein, partial [Myxococcales bacterium]|nr:sigma-54 factor interaction domain-containing protein [Myxococcales bacterium]